METKEISHSDWMNFLDEFSERHEGEFATLETIGDDIGAQTEGSRIAFVGASVDMAGGRNKVISLMFGEDADEHFEHDVYSAEHLRLKVSDGGLRDCLEIEASDGTKTLLQFDPLYALNDV